MKAASATALEPVPAPSASQNSVSFCVLKRNSPFDSVAALIGVADDARYEGEAAILLEATADRDAEGAYTFGLLAPVDSPLPDPATPLTIDPTPVLSALLDDVAGDIPVGVLSMRFHRAVVECIVRLGKVAARRVGTRYVALGVDQIVHEKLFKSS